MKTYNRTIRPKELTTDLSIAKRAFVSIALFYCLVGFPSALFYLSLTGGLYR